MQQNIILIVKTATFVKVNYTFVKIVRFMRRFLLPLLLVVCTSVSGKTFYVATNGSDMNNGTSLTTTFATWQRGINMAYPGDTVFVRGGIYYVSGYDNFPEINPAAYPTPKGRCGTASKKIYFWAYHLIMRR
jgi:hypothetical protein